MSACHDTDGTHGPEFEPLAPVGAREHSCRAAACAALMMLAGIVELDAARVGQDACAVGATTTRCLDSEAATTAAQAPTGAPSKEKPPHTSFLRWVHTDVMWMPAESGVSLVGLVGMHVTVARVGRVEFFGPPGVMLVREQTDRGPFIRPALTWGLGYRLTSIHLPGRSKPITVFANVAKCWMNAISNQDDSLSLIGISITWVP